MLGAVPALLHSPRQLCALLHYMLLCTVPGLLLLTAILGTLLSYTLLHVLLNSMGSPCAFALPNAAVPSASADAPCLS